jgi:acetoin:2,6-dichlorophenolindophenol oxidoreductase subunit alpha
MDALTPQAAMMRPPEGMDAPAILEIYRKMCLMRSFDVKVRELWMANKIMGLAHSYVGAEAVAAGVCATLKPDDYITSTHRGHGHTIAKGGDIKKMMAELFGKYEGYNHGKGGSMHIADVESGMLGATGIVGSGMPIALGSALSAHVLGNGKVTVCFHGDGGTNQGVWHESINMAAAWKLPVVFVIENNQYAIATGIETVTGEPDLYKRAAGYGIPGVQVDGFDVFEVCKAAKEAVDRARRGDGPTLIECKYLRLLGHFVADDQAYRDLKAVEPYWAIEPVKRLGDFIVASGLASKEEAEEIMLRAASDVEDAVRYAEEECTEPPAELLYEDLYANGEIIK